MDMAADRGAFIDQSQSFNVFFAEPSYGKLTSMHFYGWKKVNVFFMNGVVTLDMCHIKVISFCSFSVISFLFIFQSMNILLS